MPNWLNNFTKRLNHEMGLRGWTAPDIAIKSGVKRQSVYDYTKGTEPKLEAAIKIAETFGMSISEFIEQDPEHPVETCWERVGQVLKKKIIESLN